MPNWLQNLLINAVTVSAVGGLLALLIRHWITSSVDLHFKALLEKEKVKLEVEKQGALELLAKENAIYPEIVELVYRIRNRLRDSIEAVKRVEGDFNSGPLGEMTFQYSERLYGYRVYLDRDTFKMLHSLKRGAQNAYILLNCFTRPDGVRAQGPFGFSREDPEIQRRIAETIPKLEECFRVVNENYEGVVPRIRSHMEGILKRDT